MREQTHSEWLFQLLFWAVVFLIDLGPEWQGYSSVREVVEVVGLSIGLQAFVAVMALRVLVPRWLDQGAVLGFLSLFFLLLIAAVQINVLVSYLYLEGAYPQTYGAYYQKYLADVGLLERLGFSYLSRYLLLSKLPHLAFPAAVLIAVNYYRQQRVVMAMRERQRVAELDALKSQLNPHFIFNTLNNIYALALQRSEHTAEAVARLSNILDYVLHHASEALVSLRSEVEMIESYIALEQLRFGDRLIVTLSNRASPEVQVPPLLFLTLLENAFKHGVAKSRLPEQVEISLAESDHALKFAVRNTVPPSSRTLEEGPRGEAIGLRNLRRQLDLQCAGRYTLTVTQTDQHYLVELTLEQPCQNLMPASSLTMSYPAAT